MSVSEISPEGPVEQAGSGLVGAESGFLVGAPASQAGLQEAGVTRQGSPLTPGLQYAQPEHPFHINFCVARNEQPAHLRSCVAKELP